MINHKHRFLFIHIPRTGGTSIETQFNYTEQKGKKHWNLNDWKHHLDDNTFNKLFKFTFVRNPWNIIISKYLCGWYCSNKRGGEIGYRSGKSLKYFLSHYKPAVHEHGDSLFDYFDPNQINFIARFENRNKDLEYISDKIGVKINTNITERSHSDKKHYTEYYDDETRKIVANRYAKDIEYFGYKFGQ